MVSKPPLSENAFIQEGYRKNPYPLWLWLAISMVLLCLLWGGGSWYAKTREQKVTDNPFLQVTNRQISLFLWQNPNFMRRHVSQKEGYLPGFKMLERMSMDPSFADSIAEAPPEVLFLYHTWNRLLRRELIPRAISSQEFALFLKECEEWQPKNWPAAPKEYVKTFQNGVPEGLKELSLNELPDDVKMAFEGWKNYTKEGDAINQVKPTFSEMETFLKAHPNYARPLWRNIHEISGDHYLKTLSSGSFDKDAVIPEEEVPPFLKVAYYNWLHRI